jgi:hypothetical protein
VGLDRFTRRRSFGTALAVIAAAMLLQMVVPDEEWARLLTIGVQGMVVIVAIATAGADTRLVGAAATGIAVLFGLSAVTLVGIGSVGPAVPRIVSLALVLLAPWAIATGLRREVREDSRVTLQTVFGGLCLYLLIGLAFGFAFNLTQDLSGDEFFSNGIDGTPNDFLYFSLATLTTTGYGDFSAATEVGRTLAVTEALAGQIYLVTVVALLVGNLGRTRGGSLAADAGRRLVDRDSGGAEASAGRDV